TGVCEFSFRQLLILVIKSRNHSQIIWMMTLTSLSLNSPLNTASIEQARRLRAIPKSQLAQDLSISPRSYSRYLNEGFPDGMQEPLSNAPHRASEVPRRTPPRRPRVVEYQFPCWPESTSSTPRGSHCKW